jgi:Uma2 family endonuclease
VIPEARCGYDRLVVRHDSQTELATIVDVDPVAVERPRRRFTGAEWDRLVEIGFFRPDERLELIDGEVRVRSPIGDPHATVASLLAEALRGAYGRGSCVREGGPFAVRDDRLYPDVVVLRGSFDDYLRRTATPADALLVVEVSDSTVATDLGDKAASYAAGGVAEYWVVSLPDQAVVIHREPKPARGRAPARFGDVTTVTKGRLIPPGARRGVSLKSFLRAP